MASDPVSERFLDPSEETGSVTHAVFIDGPAFGGAEEIKADQLKHAETRRWERMKPAAPLWGRWIPRGLSALQGALVGSHQGALEPDAARDFAVRITEATPVGADLRRVWWAWWLWAYEDKIQGALEADGFDDIARDAGIVFGIAADLGPEMADASEWNGIRRECWIERYARGVGTLEYDRTHALWATSNAAWPDERHARYAARSAIRAGVDPLQATEQLVEQLALAPQWGEVPA